NFGDATLESNSQSAVDVPAFERCPRVNGPAAIDRARRKKQRIPSRLSHSSEVLAVHEEANAPELFFRKESKNHVRLARHAVRILVEALCGGGVTLASDSAPLPRGPGAVPRRKRHILLNGVDGFSRSHVGVTGGDREWRAAPCAQELQTDVR